MKIAQGSESNSVLKRGVNALIVIGLYVKGDIKT